MPKNALSNGNRHTISLVDVPPFSWADVFHVRELVKQGFINRSRSILFPRGPFAVLPQASPTSNHVRNLQVLYIGDGKCTPGNNNELCGKNFPSTSASLVTGVVFQSLISRTPESHRQAQITIACNDRAPIHPPRLCAGGADCSCNPVFLR